jgi:hypothetical protein
MTRQASVLISDDFYVSLVGKFIIHGVYTSDIVIPTEQIIVPQLVFLFQVEADLNDMFQRLRVEVTLPEQTPRTLDVPIAPPPPLPDRKRWLLRIPFLVQQAVLRPGRIEAKVIHETGEIVATTPWISVISQAPPT